MAHVAPSDAIGAIADFFEAAIHQIIYARGIYPEGWVSAACISSLFAFPLINRAAQHCSSVTGSTALLFSCANTTVSKNTLKLL
jgi:hypothetical protein